MSLDIQIVDLVNNHIYNYGVFNAVDFAKKLREVLESHPTCGKEQRKFLNEIESKGLYDLFNSGYAINFPNGSFLDEDDFKSDLKKVIKGE